MEIDCLSFFRIATLNASFSRVIPIKNIIAAQKSLTEGILPRKRIPGKNSDCIFMPSRGKMHGSIIACGSV
jgi:hypothetical protein